VTRPDIANTLKRKLHFNTFGGNPVSSAAGRAVLKVIEEDKLQENSHIVGTYLLEKLSALADKHDIIGDVRGKGLMVGVELVKDRATKTPSVEETAHIFEKAKDMGVLLGKGGLFGNVFRIKPPMCISKQDVDYLIHVLDESMQSL
jgi:alanine-glyoxylate transaminase/(R)-3-amino-2-methylpropionate-pyruvate transaminase